ncbi:hypothetical protein NP493_2462g00014 [Ridgeia piscesae]|uniref:Fibronectin type-III domain-containing protein n=1 Tax=Ridgeia piscesae TaxID=27915 RepID=A0AAD9N0N1_RIDPI|nr:hypothetical protein NP493_2462g00014 [Ridgeia piscesae]
MLSIYCYGLAAKPKFPSSIKPNIADVTSSSVYVGWPKASNISAGLEGHYHYMLWLQADGEREKNVTRVEQGAGEQRMEAQITGLTFNKKYSLRVEPYRGLRRSGMAGGGCRVRQCARKAWAQAAEGCSGRQGRAVARARSADGRYECSRGMCWFSSSSKHKAQGWLSVQQCTALDAAHKGQAGA